jgi:hypothetical protein
VKNDFQKEKKRMISKKMRKNAEYNILNDKATQRKGMNKNPIKSTRSVRRTPQERKPVASLLPPYPVTEGAQTEGMNDQATSNSFEHPVKKIT